MNSQLKAQPRPDYYVPGGALKSTAPSYVERQADTLLLDNTIKREFCYVLTPRQMGKTSLMVRTSSALRASGIRTVIIDLTQLGTSLTVEQWYLGQLMRVARDLNLKADYLTWWREQSHLGHVQRFVTFLSDVVLGEVQEPVVIFVDEIDTTLNLPFSDDYFAAIRSLFIGRAANDRLERLTFVLLGVASPSDLVRDSRRTPFNIGVRIPLTDFTEGEASVLSPWLAPDLISAVQLLRQILFWTGGHPYLTQKTCKQVADWARSPEWNPRHVPSVVDDAIRRLFFSEQGRNQDFNLQFVRDRILESSDSVSLLRLYQRIRSGETVIDDELDPTRVALKLSGLVLSTDGRLLKVRNPIYDFVFDDVWIAAEIKKRSGLSRSIFEAVGGFFGRSKSTEFKWDAFVSYNTREHEWVKGFLVPNLSRAGLRIYSTNAPVFPASLLEGGQPFTQSRCIILVMSPDYFASEFNQFQVATALRLLDDPSTERRVIPILLKASDIPEYLKMWHYIDFTKNKIDPVAMSALLRSLGVQGNVAAITAFAPPPAKAYDTGVIRKLLDDAMDADDLNAFVYDYFRSIRESLDPIQTKKGKIQLLIERIEADGELDRLLDLTARNYPGEYRRYADLLQRTPS